MVKFKDIIDKAKEVASKGIELAKSQLEFEKMLADFDEKVGTVVSGVLQGHGYRGLRQAEEGDHYIVELAVEDESRVKHIIERDILRRYGPKDREKIVNIIPDKIRVEITYTRRRSPAPTLLQPVTTEDVHVRLYLYYFVEKKGFLSRVKREEHRISLGGFSFRSSDFIDYDAKTIDEEKLRAYLEDKLKGVGLI